MPILFNFRFEHLRPISNKIVRRRKKVFAATLRRLLSNAVAFDAISCSTPKAIENDPPWKNIIVVISSGSLAARSLHPAWRLACYRANFQSMPRINILGAAAGAVDNLSLT